MKKEFLYKNKTYEIIGACMQVHNELGKGFSENVYGDALEIEFQNQDILYDREGLLSYTLQKCKTPTLLLC